MAARYHHAAEGGRELWPGGDEGMVRAADREATAEIERCLPLCTPARTLYHRSLSMKRAVFGCVVLTLCLACCHANSQERAKGRGAPRGKGKASASASASEPYAGSRWEYQVHSKPEVVKLGGGSLRSGLNKLGEEGWEMIGLEPAAGSGELYFKRPAGAASRAAGVPGADVT
jgi:hypothetical protein